MSGIEMPSRRQLLIGGALFAAAGVAYARTPHERMLVIGKDELEGSIPLKIGNWSYETKSGLVLPPPDQLSAQIYDQVLTRVYTAPDDLPVMLLIAYGSSQGGMLQVHRPEFCYPAGGYKLSDTEQTSVPVPGIEPIPSRFFTASSETRVEQLLYWTRIGHYFPQLWRDQRLAVFRANMAGLIPDGVLVRTSTITGDRVAAEATLKRFAATLVGSAGKVGRQLLLGA